MAVAVVRRGRWPGRVQRARGSGYPHFARRANRSGYAFGSRFTFGAGWACWSRFQWRGGSTCPEDNEVDTLEHVKATLRDDERSEHEDIMADAAAWRFACLTSLRPDESHVDEFVADHGRAPRELTCDFPTGAARRARGDDNCSASPSSLPATLRPRPHGTPAPRRGACGKI